MIRKKRYMMSEVKRRMTWEEQVQWVMKNTDVEWENLYIVEEVYKDTTPTHIVTTQIGEEIITTYENVKDEIS
jgi:hypothetical protein